MIKYFIIYYVILVILSTISLIFKKISRISENLSAKSWYAFSGAISCIGSSVAEYVMLAFFKAKLPSFFIVIMSFGFALITIYGCWCIFKMMKYES